MTAETKEISDNPEGLSELGTFFEAPDIDLNYYIDQSNLKKLSEKLSKKVVVLSIAFAIPESKSTIAIVLDPKEEKKGMLITSDKKTAKIFYDALRAVKQEKENK